MKSTVRTCFISKNFVLHLRLCQVRGSFHSEISYFAHLETSSARSYAEPFLAIIATANFGAAPASHADVPIKSNRLNLARVSHASKQMTLMLLRNCYTYPRRDLQCIVSTDIFAITSKKVVPLRTSHSSAQPTPQNLLVASTCLSES
ncbi:hypothetical protein PISMIDRAFT_153070 [Pisolithus microcarpus 441]|uniref:Uncharacterized protein n=1 Tax=Pisolithus microcarpus 441 TaxID=765257 RepID=A0A0C9YS12_9AGAM|nr:hypothetical protein PISMIDRAFT_153070 [Pisolithus microcarpus 441]